MSAAGWTVARLTADWAAVGRQLPDHPGGMMRGRLQAVTVMIND